MKPKLAFLTAVVLLPLTSFSARAEETDESLLLSGFEEPLVDEWRSNNEKYPAFVAELDPEKVKEGTSSGKWESGPQSNPWLFLKEIPTDWSEYEGLSLWLYSENGNGQLVNITVKSGEGYYLYQIYVDWQGWNHVIIPIAAFKAPRPVVGWSDVSGLMISLKGYGQEEPLPDTLLYFDDLRLIRR